MARISDTIPREREIQVGKDTALFIRTPSIEGWDRLVAVFTENAEHFKGVQEDSQFFQRVATIGKSPLRQIISIIFSDGNDRDLTTQEVGTLRIDLSDFLEKFVEVWGVHRLVSFFAQFLVQVREVVEKAKTSPTPPSPISSASGTGGPSASSDATGAKS